MTDEATDGAGNHEPMRHEDFAIGQAFETATGTWRCTDVGTRTIVAIKVSDHHDDRSWFNGPPYAVAEMVFDEYDLEGCWPVGSAEGQDAEEGGRAATKRLEATRSELLTAVREAASDLHDAGVMETRTLGRLYAMTDEAPDGDGTTRLLSVDGLAEPAARLRLTAEGVELTFLIERRAGFLGWLTADAAGHVYRLMRAYEREADMDEMIAERLAAMPDEDEISASDPAPESAGMAAKLPNDEGR